MIEGILHRFLKAVKGLHPVNSKAASGIGRLDENRKSQRFLRMLVYFAIIQIIRLIYAYKRRT